MSSPHLSQCQTVKFFAADITAAELEHYFLCDSSTLLLAQLYLQRALAARGIVLCNRKQQEQKSGLEN